MTYLEPILFVFLAISALGVWWIGRRRGKLVVTAGLVGILLFTWPPFDWLFSRPLEGQYPLRPYKATVRTDAIVVLGESVRPAQFEQPYPLARDHTYERCEHAAWIYKRFGPQPILVSGGSVHGTTVADVMRELLRRDGIPENMIWTEDESHSTHENAVFSTKVLREHGVSRIALVVDTASMLRASACFRKLGIDVVPAPCGFRDWGPWQDEFLPSWKAVRHNEETLHEILGLAWYRMRGWI